MATNCHDKVVAQGIYIVMRAHCSAAVNCSKYYGNPREFG
jgi:hypothetical protein